MRNFNVRSKTVRSSLLVALAVLASSPVIAETWPGKTPVVGGAVAAKVVGQVCNALNAAEIGELDQYIDRYVSALEPSDPAVSRRIRSDILPALEAEYRATHSKSDGCSPGSVEMAQDMLARVRRYRDNAGYWERVLSRRVGAFEAVQAKAVAKTCAGALKDADIATLDSFIHAEMSEFAENASKSDTEATWQHIRKLEEHTLAGLAGEEGCTRAEVQEAQEVVRKVAAVRDTKAQ